MHMASESENLVSTMLALQEGRKADRLSAWLQYIFDIIKQFLKGFLRLTSLYFCLSYILLSKLTEGHIAFLQNIMISHHNCNMQLTVCQAD